MWEFSDVKHTLTSLETREALPIRRRKSAFSSDTTDTRRNNDFTTLLFIRILLHTTWDSMKTHSASLLFKILINLQLNPSLNSSQLKMMISPWTIYSWVAYNLSNPGCSKSWNNEGKQHTSESSCHHCTSTVVVFGSFPPRVAAARIGQVISHPTVMTHALYLLQTSFTPTWPECCKSCKSLSEGSQTAVRLKRETIKENKYEVMIRNNNEILLDLGSPLHES